MQGKKMKKDRAGKKGGGGGCGADLHTEGACDFLPWRKKKRREARRIAERSATRSRSEGDKKKLKGDTTKPAKKKEKLGELKGQVCPLSLPKFRIVS